MAVWDHPATNTKVKFVNKIKILALPGSLRLKSSSNQILHVLATCFPENIEFTLFDGLAKIPAFDDGDIEPDAVADFRKQLKSADGILICTPEYAFGVPGALKNALDWTVGSAEFVDKPTALVTASSSGENGHAALLLVLTALSAQIVEGGTLLIPFIRAKLNEKGEIKDPAVMDSLISVAKALIKGVVKANSGI